MALKHQTWAIERLIPYANNARTHDEAQVAQIAASMKEFGWTNPVLVDAEGEVIAGHGRLLAAKSLGMKRVPVIILGHLTPEQKRAYVIADNKLALNAGWDEAKLAAEIAALTEAGYDVGVIGFTDDELQEMIDGALGESRPQPAPTISLAERFGVPPFSVMNARIGWWQDRKRAWLALGIQSELGRGEQPNSGAVMPAGGDTKGRFLAARGYAPRSKAKDAHAIHSGKLGNGGLTDQVSKAARKRKANAIPGGSREPLARARAGEKSIMKKSGKANATPGGSKMPSASYSKDRARGDGRGRPVPA